MLKELPKTTSKRTIESIYVLTALQVINYN